jgi:hypothetical protein
MLQVAQYADWKDHESEGECVGLIHFDVGSL